jgi:branched-chain amino acid transport system ATP-binding protein
VTGLIGKNGAGKSTTLRAISGFHRQFEGAIVINGIDVRGLSPWQLARAGVSLCREGAPVFHTLSISQNLAMGRRLAELRGEKSSQLDFVYELFPPLGARKNVRADSLSGGQRQMLALGTAIVSRPSVLLLDEPSAGLAWATAAGLFEAIAELRKAHICIVIAEQSERWLERCADEIVPVEMGRTRAAYHLTQAR